MEGIPWETKSTINQVRLEPTIILSLVTVIHFINTDPSSAGLFKGFDPGFFRQKTNMEPENYHIIPQLAVYTTNIPLIYCLLGDYIYIYIYITYHLLREPETAIDVLPFSKSMFQVPAVNKFPGVLRSWFNMSPGKTPHAKTCTFNHSLQVLGAIHYNTHISSF